RRQWCEIKSPLRGTVLTTYFEPGEMVGPGSKLLTIGNLDEVYAYFYLPHDEISHLKLQQEVTAFLPELEKKPFSGVISFINPEAEFTPKNVQTREERTRLVYGVKVSFQNPEGVLKPGMTLEWGVKK
ncbi:MAG: efflux RND transporter periplasmic adaptor subunit, partial [Bdellovibrio sp.]|nr:efflux RND transporter periplasmic adaptor subunit [Bdellovibrio sp.]